MGCELCGEPGPGEASAPVPLLLAPGHSSASCSLNSDVASSYLQHPGCTACAQLCAPYGSGTCLHAPLPLAPLAWQCTSGRELAPLASPSLSLTLLARAVLLPGAARGLALCTRWSFSEGQHERPTHRRGWRPAGATGRASWRTNDPQYHAGPCHCRTSPWGPHRAACPVTRALLSLQ